MSDKSCLPLIAILDANVIVSPPNIELGEDGGILDFIDKVGDERQRVGVFDGMLVQVSVILARTESCVFLSYKEEARRLWRFRRSNLS